MRCGEAGRPAITEAELCADDVGEEGRGGSSATNTSPSLDPKTICMRIQRFPFVSPSPVPLCSTIPPITHTLLATSVAGLYVLLAQADNRGSLGVLRRYLQHSNSEIAAAKDRLPSISRTFIAMCPEDVFVCVYVGYMNGEQEKTGPPTFSLCNCVCN
jgi:hypothetical protein